MKPKRSALLIADVIGSSARRDLRAVLGQRLTLASRGAYQKQIHTAAIFGYRR
jgi:hypothetical protein